MEYLIKRLFYIKRKTVHGIKYHFLKVKERDDYFVCLAEESNFHIVKTEKLQTKEQFAQILLNIYKSMYGADNVELEVRYCLADDKKTLFKLQTYFSEEEPNELVYGRSKYKSMCDVFLEEDYIKCSKDTSILDVIKQFLINDRLITEDDVMLKFKSDVPVKRDFIVR